MAALLLALLGMDDAFFARLDAHLAQVARDSA